MSTPRKSDYEHRLSGTTSQAKPDQTSTFAAGRPRMPKYLSPVAAEKYREIVRLLAKRGTATRLDATALEVLSVTYERWRALCDEIRQYGPMVDSVVLDSSGAAHTKRVQNPAAKLAAQAENSMRAMLKELSATPASREKSKPAAPPERKPEHNEEYIDIV